MAHQPLESGNIAARVARLATNILATGLILILGAVGGQQALRWWSAARSTAAPDPLADVLGPAAVRRQPPSADAAGESDRHLLAFGDYPLLATRTELRGDVPDVLARLRDDCRLIARRVDRVDRAAGPAERRMLTRIRLLEPIESTTRWRMYQIDEPLPMVVTVLDQPAPSPAGQDRDVATAESRVVSWGLAFPAVSGEGMPSDEMPSDRWTLFTLTADNPELGTLAAHRGLTVPPRSRRTMSLQAESGAVMVGFRGTGSVSAWKLFYDRELAVPRWTPASGWRHDGPTWQRSFTSPRDGRLDVQLFEAADGSLNGILMAAPPSGGATEK